MTSVIDSLGLSIEFQFSQILEEIQIDSIRFLQIWVNSISIEVRWNITWAVRDGTEYRT